MDITKSILGTSKFSAKLRKDLTRLAALKSPLFLTGPRGSGRTHAAKLIHKLSGPRELVILNAQVASAEQLRASFEKFRTGTVTLLIQEIESFSFLNQSLILKEILDIPQKSSSRLIITSLSSPPELESSSTIHPDLAKFLKKLETVKFSPLKDREEDIPYLVEEFVKVACASAHLELKTIDINALDSLIRKIWPENIKDLKSFVERLVLESDGATIELPKEFADEVEQVQGIISQIAKKKTFGFDESLAFLERTLIERVLESVGYNQVKAAEMIGLSEANFRYRLKKYDIPSSRKRLVPE